MEGGFLVSYVQPYAQPPRREYATAKAKIHATAEPRMYEPQNREYAHHSTENMRNRRTGKRGRMTTIQEEIAQYLTAHCDVQYQAFQSKLIPSIDPATMIGVRTPDLRKLAKSLAKRDDVNDFLAALPHRLFDENQVHAFIISSERDYDTLVAHIETFLPYIDNWATCDQLSPKNLAQCPQRTLEFVQKWLASPNVYTVRFGIGVLLRLFLDERFTPEHLRWVATVYTDEYYINMMRAWYFAEALAKQPDAALPYIEQGKLDTWTHNKAIQKARESRRITPEMKEYLKSLKRSL